MVFRKSIRLKILMQFLLYASLWYIEYVQSLLDHPIQVFFWFSVLIFAFTCVLTCTCVYSYDRVLMLSGFINGLCWCCLGSSMVCGDVVWVHQWSVEMLSGFINGLWRCCLGSSMVCVDVVWVHPWSVLMLFGFIDGLCWCCLGTAMIVWRCCLGSSMVCFS